MHKTKEERLFSPFLKFSNEFFIEVVGIFVIEKEASLACLMVGGDWVQKMKRKRRLEIIREKDIRVKFESLRKDRGEGGK